MKNKIKQKQNNLNNQLIIQIKNNIYIDESGTQYNQRLGIGEKVFGCHKGKRENKYYCST